MCSFVVGFLKICRIETLNGYFLIGSLFTLKKRGTFRLHKNGSLFVFLKARSRFRS